MSIPFAPKVLFCSTVIIFSFAFEQSFREGVINFFFCFEFFLKMEHREAFLLDVVGIEFVSTVKF